MTEALSLSPVEAALATCRATLSSVASVRCWSMADPQLGSAIAEITSVASQLEELRLRLVVAADDRGIATRSGRAPPGPGCRGWQ